MNDNNFLKNFRISIFFTILFLFCFVFVILKSTADLDLWHRMAVGRIFSQTGWIIYHDIFSYFPTKEMWVDHEWLSGIIFYYLGHYFGDYGILALQTSIVFAVMSLIFAANRLLCPENKYRISYYFVALLAIIPGLSSSVRCQAFTFLFFALWIYLLERVKRGETGFIWVFPATMLLWTNMHGGFLAGIGLVGFYTVGDFLDKKNIKNYLAILALILPVTLVNPYGIDYWAYMLDAVTMHRPHITEWAAFDPLKSLYNQPGAKVLFIILLLGYGFKLFKKQLDFDRIEIIALLVTIYLSLKHERHIMFFAIAGAVYGYRHFAAFLNGVFDKVRPKILALLPADRVEQAYFFKESLVYMFSMMLCFYIISTTEISLKMGFYPTRAIEFLKINNVSGNLFIPFNWGSYAMWKLYPQNLVSIDGRYEEAYKNEAYDDVCHLSFFGKRWNEVLGKYKHDILLLEVDSDVYKKVRDLPEWKIVFETEKAAVFLPAGDTRNGWKKPIDDDGYYVKTKYENGIML